MITLSMVRVEKAALLVELRIPYKVLVGEHARNRWEGSIKINFGKADRKVLDSNRIRWGLL